MATADIPYCVYVVPTLNVEKTRYFLLYHVASCHSNNVQM